MHARMNNFSHSRAWANFMYRECRRISTSRYLHGKTRPSHVRSCGIYESVRMDKSGSRACVRACVRESDRARMSDWALIHLTDTSRPIERTFEIRCVWNESVSLRCLGTRKLRRAVAVKWSFLPTFFFYILPHFFGLARKRNKKLTWLIKLKTLVLN